LYLLIIISMVTLESETVGFSGYLGKGILRNYNLRQSMPILKVGLHYLQGNQIIYIAMLILCLK